MYKDMIKSMTSNFKAFINSIKGLRVKATKVEKPKQYHCYCGSIQMICEIHRDDPIANKVNPRAVKAYWDRRDGIYNETNEMVDDIMKKDNERTYLWDKPRKFNDYLSRPWTLKRRISFMMQKIKRIFINVCKLFISVDTSHFNGFDKSSHAFWSNKWIFVRLFSGLIEFKFHLTNYAHSKPWYYGTGVRFRVSICGVFKTHLIFNIGPWANEH